MGDQELIDLCQEVHDRTAWEDTDAILVFLGTHWEIDRRPTMEGVRGLINAHHPLYSTDYLMDKLTEIHYQLRVEHNHSDMTWYAYYAGRDERHLFDDENDWYNGGGTPQKALLKLTIALAKAGELKR